MIDFNTIGALYIKYGSDEDGFNEYHELTEERKIHPDGTNMVVVVRNRDVSWEPGHYQLRFSREGSSITLKGDDFFVGEKKEHVSEPVLEDGMWVLSVEEKNGADVAQIIIEIEDFVEPMSMSSDIEHPGTKPVQFSEFRKNLLSYVEKVAQPLGQAEKLHIALPNKRIAVLERFDCALGVELSCAYIHGCQASDLKRFGMTVFTALHLNMAFLFPVSVDDEDILLILRLDQSCSHPADRFCSEITQGWDASYPTRAMFKGL